MTENAGNIPTLTQRVETLGEDMGNYRRAISRTGFGRQDTDESRARARSEANSLYTHMLGEVAEGVLTLSSSDLPPFFQVVRNHGVAMGPNGYAEFLERSLIRVRELVEQRQVPPQSE